MVEPPRKRRKQDEQGSRRLANENAIDTDFEELLSKHGSSYSRPQLKLCARMLVNDLHDSCDSPPDKPIITGPPRVKKKINTV